MNDGVDVVVADDAADQCLVAGLTDAMVTAYGLPADAVQVWIKEPPPDSWGQGGKLRADS